MSRRSKASIDAADPYATHGAGRASLVCAALAVLGAAWGLVVTGGLPVGGVATTTAGLGLAALVRRATSSRSARAWTKVLAAGAGAVWLPGVVSSSGVFALWPVLALCLAVRQFASARSLREVRLVLGLSVLVVLAAAGVSPVAALVGPLAVVWSGVLVGFAGAVPHRVGGAAQRARTLRAVAAAGVAGVLLFLLVPAGGGASSAGGALGRAAASAAGGERSAAPRSGAAYAGGDLDLSSRGELPQTELVSVPADSPGWWRSAVLDTYDGRTWTGGPVASWSSGPSPAGDGSSQWSAVGEDGATGPQRVDVVEPVSGDYPALLSAGAPVAVSSPGVDLRVVPSGAAAWLGPVGSPYAVTSALTPTVDARAGSPAGVGAGEAPVDEQRWVQLPSSLPQRVRDLGVRLAAGRGPVAAARAVNEHLHASARYSLDAPVPATGEDAVDAFLFEDRIGFCEHFASAEVVLLRSAGIPARLVTGFGGGTDAGGRRVFRGADAHAWVEVWVPGQGWTTSDPTAGAQLVAGDRPSWVARVWSWVQRTVAGLLASAVARTVLAVVLVAVAVGAWALLRAGARRRARTGVPGAVVARRRGEGVSPSVLALLVAWERFDAALPPERRRGGAEGLSTWRARLLTPAGAGPLAARREELGAALAVVERACFARRVPSRAELEGAVATLERASSTVLAAARVAGSAGARG
ncbi:transglutaminase family protein [Kineococcus sp. GCM10028916]|uniref:transglutaminase family protein n=1 Tax=Kineococcus sp. GCM10028916 TaxID=3273394 RepID=UPI003636C611